MKRLLSIVLVLALTLSLFAVCVSAAETKVSLIPAEGATWVNTDHNGASVVVEYKDGAVVFSGSVASSWPCTESWYIDNPIVADTTDDYLSIDFTVAGGTTNINLFFDDGNGGSLGYSISNSALNAACPGAPIDEGSGDLYDGEYKCTISIADLVASTQNLQAKPFPEGAVVDGQVKIIGINVYSVNGATVTINDLSVVNVGEAAPAPELGGNELAIAATDEAIAFEDGKIGYYPAGDADRVVSSDDFNFRYVFIIVCDANGNIVEIGNNLLTTTEEASKDAEYQNDFTVPAGGFAISYFYNADSPANQPLHDIYTSITGELEDPAKALYNVTAKVEGEVNYTLACDGSVLTITEKTETPAPETSEDDKPQTGDAGVLVFAVLAVVAIAGCATVVKTRG